jgi:hypothetical protein
MRSAAVGIILGIVLVSALAGCGSSVVDQPSLVPSASPRANDPCAAIPTIDPANPPDTLGLTGDPTLEAEFPAEIDDETVTDVASARWIEALCDMGGTASVDAAALNLPSDLDQSAMSVGSAAATVDGKAVTIVAFRLPGHRGDELLGAFGDLSAAIFPDAPKFNTALTATTAGGKSVSRWTNAADGSVSYLYVSGDTLWTVDSIDQSQADKIFAALP